MTNHARFFFSLRLLLLLLGAFKEKERERRRRKHLKTPWEIKTWEGGRSSPSKSKDEAAYRAVAAAEAAASLIAS